MHDVDDARFIEKTHRLHTLILICMIYCVLSGKIYWIEWNFLCGKLDEALSPLREDLGDGRPKKKSRLFFNRHSSKVRALKNLQRVCDKQSKQLPHVNFTLYCPWDGTGNDKSVSNWHIQLRVTDSGVPASVSVPFTTNDRQHSTDWDNTCRSEPLGVDVVGIHGNRRQTSDIADRNVVSNPTMTNPFEDDVANDGIASSRDALMELDHMSHHHEDEIWMHVPSLGGNYDSEQLPIPLRPPPLRPQT